jgi:hypothetical protein
MECYETRWGWFFRYYHQPRDIGFFIEDQPPYIAIPLKIHDIGILKRIEYNSLPAKIKVSIAATQSVIVETSQESLARMRDKDD